MSDAQEQTLEAAETEEKTEEKQAVSAEQLEQLTAQLDAIKKAQAGSDKKVQELTEALRAKEEEASTVKKSAEEQIAEIRESLQKAEAEKERERLKGRAREMLDEQGLKAAPIVLERLVGTSEDETKELVEAFSAYMKDTLSENRMEYDRDHGRTVSGPKRDAPTSYDNLLDMSEEQMKSLDPRDIANIIKKEAERGGHIKAG